MNMLPVPFEHVPLFVKNFFRYRSENGDYFFFKIQRSGRGRFSVYPAPIDHKNQADGQLVRLLSKILHN